jgi:hypothetical protein
VLVKYDGDGEKQDRSWEMEHAIRQIVSGAIVPGQTLIEKPCTSAIFRRERVPGVQDHVVNFLQPDLA